jgi:hypothetical protein
MARQTLERRIDDLDVAVTQFKPTDAYHLVAFALKTFGPVLGVVAPSVLSGGLGALLAMDAGALGLAFAQLDIDAADRLRDSLLRGTTLVAERNGKRVQYDLSKGKNEIDDAFEEGGLGAMFGVLKFAVEANFKGFTKSAAALAGAAAAPGPATPST